MEIDKILSELRREKRQIEAAIEALERLRKRGGSRKQLSEKRGRRQGRKATPPRRGMGRGMETNNLISFPALRRSGS